MFDDSVLVMRHDILYIESVLYMNMLKHAHVFGEQ